MAGRSDIEWPGAASWVPETPDLESLRAAMQDCRGCELHRDAIQAVPGDGAADAPVMLVGEQPGDLEDQEGEPFVGPAGRLLDKALAEAGIPPEHVFETNAVKHFRFSGTHGKQRIHKSPDRAHIAACQPWLLAELDLVRPTGVVLLGGTAGKAVYGSGFRVGEARGRLQPWPEALDTAGSPKWVLATTHPSAVLRSRDRGRDFEALVADLRVAAKALG